jgi:hypothetical protein
VRLKFRHKVHPAKENLSGDLSCEPDLYLFRTAAIVPACVLPVLVLVATNFSPGFSEEMGTAFPLARSTLVPGVKLSPQTSAAIPHLTENFWRVCGQRIS